MSKNAIAVVPNNNAVEMNRPREVQGWRVGRPVEDPEKTKTWGYVSAKPSEFLVHVRRGAVRERSSGQGTTCFKWPWDSVAIVPTSLQRLQFQADQVTKERVGVEVTGLAVFRIAEPLLAYRVLNFSYPERAQEKLEETLREMFIGAARRLIANLSVDDCLQKRKSALAVELLREIAPVVGGSGRPSDNTDKGWGVVIDTIEIQEVRVMSAQVFAAMQAPFRAALEQRAREATADANREIALRESACNRSIEEARIATNVELEAQRRSAENADAEAQRQRALDDNQARRALREAEAAAEVALAEQRARAELALEEQRVRAAVALEEQRARAELEAAELRAKALEAQIALERAQNEARREQRRAELELATLEGRLDVELARQRAEVERATAAARAQVLTAEKLPELAAALGERIGDVRIVQMGGDGNPFAQLTQGVSAVLEMVKAVHEHQK